MYAIIQTGGKQYRVQKDDILEVATLDGKEGDTISLGEILMLGVDGKATIGSPLVSGASVTATVVRHKKTDKVIVFKKKRRQNYRRKNGHRQNVTVVKITDIKA